MDSGQPGLDFSRKLNRGHLPLFWPLPRGIMNKCCAIFIIFARDGTLDPIQSQTVCVLLGVLTAMGADETVIPFVKQNQIQP